MSKLKDLITDGPVHERRITMRSYPVGADRLLVEGWLRDERFISMYRWDSRLTAPSVVHHIGVRLLIGGWPVSIIEAEAEMETVPHEDCIQALPTVEKVVGMSIVSGYSDEVRRRLGGAAGCAHLTHLLLVMGPAALHGFWTHLGRHPRPKPKSVDDLKGLSAFIDSCLLWTKDGPLMAHLHQMVAEEGGKPE